MLSIVAKGQHWRWVNYLQGGSSNHAVFDVHVPPGENFAYAVGRYRATATFYGQDTNIVNPYHAGDRDVYIAKIDSNGNYVWLVTDGGTYSEYANAICTDESGNVYIAGTFEQTAFFDTTPIVGDVAGDVFVAKYDSNGIFQWVVPFAGPGWEWAQEIECDLNGNIYVGGYQAGDFNYGSGTLPEKGFFVMKLDYDGNLIWCVGPDNISAAGESWVYGMKYYNNKLYFSGNVRNSVNFGPFNLPAYAWTDGYIAQLDLDGNFENAFKFGGIYFDICNDIELHGDTIYAVGSYSQYADFDTITMYAPIIGSGGADALNSRDAFLAKFLTNGTCLWVKDIKGDYIDESHSVLVNKSNNIVITGSYGQIDINSSCCAYGEIYVREYDDNGNINWTLQPDGGGHLGEGMAIEEDSKGNYFFGGKMKGNHYFQDILVTTPNLINHTAIMSRIYPPLSLPDDSTYQVCPNDTVWVYAPKSLGSPQIGNWNTGSGLILYQNLDSILVVTSNLDSLYYTVTNSFKTTVYDKDTMVFYFNELNLPLSILPLEIDTCADSLELNAGALSEFYNWGGGMVQYDSLHVVYFSGEYIVELIGLNGCINADTVNVLLNYLQNVDLGPDVSTCENHYILNAGGSGGYYDWGSGFVANDSIFNVYSSGVYSVVVEDSAGCIATDEIYVDLLDCSEIEELFFEWQIWFDAATNSLRLNSECQDCDITVLDYSGRVLHSFSVNSSSMNLPALSSGNYIILLINSDLTIVNRTLIFMK